MNANAALYIENQYTGSGLSSFQNNGGTGVYIETSSTCANDVPIKFWEYPRAAGVSATDRCTHKIEFSNEQSKVDACKLHSSDTLCKADTNCNLAPLTIAICFLGKTFEQFKNLPPTSPAWFTGDDNLAGTTVTGTEGDS